MCHVLHCQSAVCFFCISIKADVLVNTITCPTSDLAKAGVVSSSLLSAAGSQLQTVSAECRQCILNLVMSETAL